MKHYQDSQIQVKSRRWGVAIALVVLCCLGLTVSGASVMHRWELQVWQSRFAEMAHIQKSNFQTLLEQRLELAEASSLVDDTHPKLDEMISQMAEKNNLIKSYLKLYLIDVTNSQQPTLVYGAEDEFSRKQLDRLKTVAGNRSPFVLEQEDTIVEPMFFANRHWRLFIQPSARLKHERAHWASMVLLTAGLVLTALLFALLTSFARHTKKVQLRVDERTRQISDANALLGDVIRKKEKALEDLSKSEARFRLLTENSTDVIARHDLNGLCLYASPAAHQLLGYDVNEMVGRSIYALLCDEDIEAMQQVFQAIQDSEKVRGIVYQARHKNGAHVWFEANFLPILNPETGKLSEVQSVSRDITARKKAEVALRENEERFRGAFEDAAIGMALVETTGQIQRVNHSLCQLTGYAREELVASDLKNMTHPADMSDYLDKARAVVDGRLDVLKMEMRLIHKKGHILWTLLNATLVSHTEASDGYFVYQIQDVSDRKKAEKALEVLSSRHKLILNAAGEGIIGVNLEGKIMFANVAAEKMLGYKQGELQGKPFHPWVLHTRQDGSPYPFRESPLFKALHLGETVSVDDELFWCENQTSFISSYVCAPIQSEDTISGGVIVFSNVAEGMISQMAKKLMRGESTARKRIWTEES